MYTLISLIQLYEGSPSQCNKITKKKKKMVWGGGDKCHKYQKGRHKTILICNDMTVYVKQSEVPSHLPKNPPNPS